MPNVTRALARKVAEERRDKANDCFRAANEHNALNGADSVFGRYYALEGLHWLRAARAADKGDVTPTPYLPAA